MEKKPIIAAKYYYTLAEMVEQLETLQRGKGISYCAPWGIDSHTLTSLKAALAKIEPQRHSCPDDR